MPAEFMQMGPKMNTEELCAAMKTLPPVDYEHANLRELEVAG